MRDDFEVAFVGAGAGAAGLAAAQCLASRPLDVAVLEARDRIGRRGHTVRPRPDPPLDAGAGWPYSADINPLVPMIEAAGFAIDHGMPPGEKQAGNQDFPPDDQAAFADAVAEQRLSEFTPPVRPFRA